MFRKYLRFKSVCLKQPLLKAEHSELLSNRNFPFDVIAERRFDIVAGISEKEERETC